MLSTIWKFCWFLHLHVHKWTHVPLVRRSVHYVTALLAIVFLSPQAHHRWRKRRTLSIGIRDLRSISFLVSKTFVLLNAFLRSFPFQAKVVDRDGSELYQCLKGDMYIVDLARTHGHVAMVNGVAWHPHRRHHFITGSSDRWSSTIHVYVLG